MGVSRLSGTIVGWLANTESTKREIVLAAAFLAALLATGTMGYSIIEGWDWLDGLYMTFITLTTIGFSEVKSLSDEGRIFTIFVGLVGIGAVAFIATRVAQLVLAGELLSKRHMNNRISQLRDHYIVCGYGRIGKRIAHDLDRAGKAFVVVELSSAQIETLAETNYLYLQGNAESEEVLAEAGIANAKGLILTLSDDSSNVFVTLTARELKPNIYVIARTDTRQNERKIRRAGANKVVAAYEIGADRMAQVILRPNVDRLMEEVLRSESMDLIMEEVTIQDNAPLVNKTLIGSNFRKNFNTIVVAVLDGSSDRMEFNPTPDYRFRPGDTLIVLGSPDMVSKLRKDGCTA